MTQLYPLLLSWKAKLEQIPINQSIDILIVSDSVKEIIFLANIKSYMRNIIAKAKIDILELPVWKNPVKRVCIQLYILSAVYH